MESMGDQRPGVRAGARPGQPAQAPGAPSKLQCIIQVAVCGNLDDMRSRQKKRLAGRELAVDLAGQAQAVEVVPAETAIARTTMRDRRQDTPAHRAAHGMQMDANGPGRVGCTSIVHTERVSG